MSSETYLGVDKWHDDVIRVVVCDDHALLRRRLVMELESQPDIDVMAEAADGEHAIALCRELAPDVAVVGMRVEHIGGPRTAAGIREVAGGAHVVVLVAQDDAREAVRAIKAGVTGFINRDAIEQATTVVRAVSAGIVALPPLVVQRVLDEYLSLAGQEPTPEHPLRAPTISDREQAILEQLAGGKTYAASGASVGVKDFTAKNLTANAVEKLYRHARTEAVMYAVRERLGA
jgi:DNA-binding NarL/FixJ family response regulator